MNWFQKIWNNIVTSNDEQFNKTITELQDENAQLTMQVDEYLMSLETKTKEAAELKVLIEDIKEKRAEEQRLNELEFYWNTKRPKSNNYRYPARPPLDGDSNVAVDPRIYFQEDDSIIPKVGGTTNDEIASNALRYVIERIRYTTDPVQFKKNEAWLFGFETYKLRKGDCEDGAILLANIMMKSGIPYWRIRLNAGDVQGGGHCWVTYLRESDDKWVVLDWCYWPNDSKNLKLLWDHAANYFDIWFSWNRDHIFKGSKLDR